MRGHPPSWRGWSYRFKDLKCYLRLKKIQVFSNVRTDSDSFIEDGHNIVYNYGVANCQQRWILSSEYECKRAVPQIKSSMKETVKLRGRSIENEPDVRGSVRPADPSSESITGYPSVGRDLGLGYHAFKIWPTVEWRVYAPSATASRTPQLTPTDPKFYRSVIIAGAVCVLHPRTSVRHRCGFQNSTISHVM
jgi:hypothetical protein